MGAVWEIARHHQPTDAEAPEQLRICDGRARCDRGPCAAARGGVCGFRWRRYCFGLARGTARERAAGLIERLYDRRGYRGDGSTRPNNSSLRLTLAGAHGADLFATLTVGLDGPDGLLADTLYGHEIDAFRTDGRRICELSAFAVDPAYSAHGVLLSLFRLAYFYGRLLHHVTDAFIEVNPRHVGFYERVLGFRRGGAERLCPRVAAPAVLMHLDLSAIAN